MNGVVHVGGHFGEEVDGYLAEGRSPIIVFEPQNLPHKFTDSASVIWIPVALHCETGLKVLRVPQHLTKEEGLDTQSASFLELIPERAIENGWTPTPVELCYAVTVRFDEWAKRIPYQRRCCTLLKIDVQGMEYQVLHGFGEYLKDFQEIIVECSDPPLYRGGFSAEDVAEELALAGFHRMSPILRHGDVRFMRI